MVGKAERIALIKDILFTQSQVPMSDEKNFKKLLGNKLQEI